MKLQYTKYIVMVAVATQMLFTNACGYQPLASTKSNNAESSDTPYPQNEDSPYSGNETNDSYVVHLRLRVIQLKFAGAAAYNSTFSEATIQQYVDEANKIYSQAGVKIILESVKSLTVPTSEIASITSNEDAQNFVKNKLGKISFPANNSGGPLFQVAFFKNFPFGAKGVYVPPQKTAFVGEYTKAGALNEAIVMAHELGHALSLPHSNESGETCVGENLMCTGGTGISTKLTNQQIEQMRDQASLGPV